jgi:hypothetical protein
MEMQSSDGPCCVTGVADIADISEFKFLQQKA